MEKRTLSEIVDLGFGPDKSEDFCTTLIGMVLQHSTKFAQRFVDYVLDRIGEVHGRIRSPHVRVSGQENIDRYFPGCNRFPDLWIRYSADQSPRPSLLLIEVKVGSGESNDQMTDYRRFVDDIKQGNSNHFDNAHLAFLSLSENPRLSAQPDVAITWAEVVALLDEHLRSALEFEANFVSAVRRHLEMIRNRYVSRAPVGEAPEFIAMLAGLPHRYPWISHVGPTLGGVQHTVVPVTSHPWIERVIRSGGSTSAALIGVNPHRKPHLDSFPETWLRLLLPQSESAKEWHRRIHRVKNSLPELQVAIEDVFQAMDDRRKRESP